MTNVLDKFIQDMKNNIPGFIAVSVTEVRSGVSYGSDSVDPSFDPNLASAYNLEVVKAKQNALQVLGLASKERIVDIIITLTDPFSPVTYISENFLPLSRYSFTAVISDSSFPVS